MLSAIWKKYDQGNRNIDILLISIKFWNGVRFSGCQASTKFSSCVWEWKKKKKKKAAINENTCFLNLWRLIFTQKFKQWCFLTFSQRTQNSFLISIFFPNLGWNFDATLKQGYTPLSSTKRSATSFSRDRRKILFLYYHESYAKKKNWILFTGIEHMTSLWMWASWKLHEWQKLQQIR